MKKTIPGIFGFEPLQSKKQVVSRICPKAPVQTFYTHTEKSRQTDM